MSATRTLDAAVDPCAATSRAFTPARDGAERALVVDGSAVLRREDFGALQLEGEIAGGRSGDQADHDQRHCERPRVGQHVRGVREHSPEGGPRDAG
jgi:hypothetical protein